MLLVETSVDDLGDIFRMGICPYCESGSIRDEIYKWAIPPMGRALHAMQSQVSCNEIALPHRRPRGSGPRQRRLAAC